MQYAINKNSARTFSESLPIVAAALGRRCGVTVEFGAECASTDGQTIRLPDIAVQSEQEEKLLLGLLCHECGHVRFTDIDLLDGKASPFERELDNALEDVRIERAMSGIYPGAEALFNAAHREPVEQLLQKRVIGKQSVIPLYALALPEWRLMGRSYLEPLVAKLRKRLVSRFGEALTKRVDELALSVENARSLDDVQEIRKQIVQELRLVAEAPRQEPRPEPRNGAAESNQPKAGSAGSGSDSSADGSENKGPSAEARAALEADAEQVSNPLSLSTAFKRLGKGKACGSNSELDASPTGLRPIKGSAERGIQRIALGKSDSAALRRPLMSLVQSKLDAGIRHTERGRRLATRRLARLAVGDARVFRRSNPKKATSAAVHVLLDLSGSMGAVGADLGLRAGIGLVHALQGIRSVNPALTVFPGAACGLRQQAACTVIPHGTRLERVDVREIGGIESWGPTPIEPALRIAGKALSGCKETAKIVLLVTDGVISATRLRSVKAELEAAGVKIFGIQIGCDSGLSRLLPKSISIQTVEELKTALFSLAGDAFSAL